MPQESALERIEMPVPPAAAKRRLSRIVGHDMSALALKAGLMVVPMMIGLSVIVDYLRP
jgi:hypothetical protein